MKSTESKENDCPVRFVWGTFCKNVLEDGGLKTLYSVLPGLNFHVSPQRTKTRNAMPTALLLPIGELAVYALIGRREASAEPLSVNLSVEWNLPTAENMEVPFVIDATQDSFQLVLKMNHARIPVNLTTPETSLQLTCRLLFSGTIIGEVGLPIKVFVHEEGVKVE
jgi:hypothetical protein